MLPVVVTAVEPALVNSFVVYPNPAEGYVQVHSSTPGLLDVISSGGRVLQENLPLAKESETTLNTSRWSPGLYLFRARYGERHEVRKVLVK